MKVAGASFILLFLVAVILGWIMNIVDLFHQSFDPLTAVAVLRVVGIFVPPLGAVMGWFW